MASKNDITGDSIASRVSKKYSSNYDEIDWSKSGSDIADEILFWIHRCGNINVQTRVGKPCPVCNKNQEDIS